MAQAEIEDTLGLRILKALAARRMKLVDLERETGIPNSLLSQYVHDKAEPTLQRFRLVCNALGVSPDELLGWDEGSTRVFLQGLAPEQEALPFESAVA